MSNTKPLGLQLNDLSFAYEKNSNRILDQLSLTLEHQEVVSLMGLSGSGKSTILNCIAGFQTPIKGEISLNGRILSDRKTFTKAEARNIGMVFQDYALFPHLNVEQNIGFGLTHSSKQEKSGRCQELLEMTGLLNFAKAMPHEISGGQQQRVALARALAPKPQLILLDEPFSNLDSQLRQKLAQETREFLKHEQMTALMVTHDQQEAFSFADKVGVLNNGALCQWDSPQQVFENPNSVFVAEFLNEGNVLSANLQNNAQLSIADMPFMTLSEDICCYLNGEEVDLSRLSSQSQNDLQVLLRSTDIQIDPDSSLRAKLLNQRYLGGSYLNELSLANGQKFYLSTEKDLNLQTNEHYGIAYSSNKLLCFQ